jgi:hypothetical protein
MNTAMSSASAARTALQSTGRTMLGVVGSILLVASALVGLAPSASAINPTPCAGRTDFARAASSTLGLKCWANAGATNTNVARVTQLCSGNNVVTWTYRWSMGTSTLTQARNSCTGFSDITVIRVSIR